MPNSFSTGFATFSRICLLLVLPAILYFPLTARPDGAELTVIAEFGTPGSGVGQFDTPSGIAVNSRGEIIVADSANHRVQVCQRDGNCRAFGSYGDQAGQFSWPLDVAVDSQDRIFVVDADNRRMQVCSDQGSCAVVGSFGSQPGKFDAPVAVSVDSQDRMVIADSNNGRVQICTTAGQCTAIGTLAKDPNHYQPGEFGFIQGVAVDRYDRILASDSLGQGTPQRLQILMHGQWLEIGPTTTPSGRFDNPGEVAVDRYNRIFVGDYPDTTHRCDVSGRCEKLDLFGKLAFTASNEIVVSDSANSRIRILENTPVVLINAGLNDAWFNPETAGQGFFITFFPDLEQVFLAWFTYEVQRPEGSISARLGEPGHRWLTAQGDFIDNQAVLDIWISSGGVFDSAAPSPVNRKDGEAILEFSDCNAGTLSYSIPSINAWGVVPIERITLENVPLCEQLNSALH